MRTLRTALLAVFGMALLPAIASADRWSSSSRYYRDDGREVRTTYSRDYYRPTYSTSSHGNYDRDDRAPRYSSGVSISYSSGYNAPSYYASYREPVYYSAPTYCAPVYSYSYAAPTYCAPVYRYAAPSYCAPAYRSSSCYRPSYGGGLSINFSYRSR